MSITSTESFQGRAQRSEATRVLIWMIVLMAMLLLTVARRLEEGVVMSDDRVFYPYTGVLAAALAIQVPLLVALRRANRRGELLPNWLWRASASFDLAAVAALLVIVAFLSPRGPMPALSAPPLLLLPLVVLLSIFRLRPGFTLGAGLTAAGIHLMLAMRAIGVTEAPPEAYPVNLSYGVILGITALASAFVSRQVRDHVREATEEAVAHERAEQEVRGMRRDLAVAREIQRGLLPTQAPEVRGFEIAGMNRPADQTGGDYYDWQPLPNGKLAVMLADVSGHGIGPALMMAVCRAYARATAPTSPDPAALLSRLNELLHADLSRGRFITFVLALLGEDGETQLVSAGHGPTLLYRAASGEVEEYGSAGLPLGILPTETYSPITFLALEQGDILVMVTDGFFEWRRLGDGEQFGVSGVRETLHGHAARSAAEVLEAIDGTVRAFVGGSIQSDDMTAIVIKRTAAAGVHRHASVAAAAG